MALSMQGTLFRYGPKQAHTAFISGRHRKHVILVGGLGDGMLLAKYVAQLAARLDIISWSLVQPLLSSSLSGWGIGSLDEDADELSLLANHMIDARDSEEFVLCGHSTGTQDAVRYVNRAVSSGAPQPRGVILQAPVSDRDWLATNSSTQQRLDLCRNMIDEGRAEDIAFRCPSISYDKHRDDDGTPVTARRFASLAGSGGDDNMFSESFTEQQLQEKLGKLVEMPTLWMMSGSDEYVPASIDKGALRRKFEDVLCHPKSRCVVVEGAVHNLSGHEDEAVEIMADFVSSL